MSAYNSYFCLLAEDGEEEEVATLLIGRTHLKKLSSATGIVFVLFLEKLAIM